MKTTRRTFVNSFLFALGAIFLPKPRTIEAAQKALVLPRDTQEPELLRFQGLQGPIGKCGQETQHLPEFYHNQFYQSEQNLICQYVGRGKPFHQAKKLKTVKLESVTKDDAMVDDQPYSNQWFTDQGIFREGRAGRNHTI